MILNVMRQLIILCAAHATVRMHEKASVYMIKIIERICYNMTIVWFRISYCSFLVLYIYINYMHIGLSIFPE